MTVTDALYSGHDRGRGAVRSCNSRPHREAGSSGAREPAAGAATGDTIMAGRIVLPLLSFGTGAADAFAFTALGGTFTANMTGNAVLAVIFTRIVYWNMLLGALAALAGFVVALVVGFRLTAAKASGPTGTGRALLALGMSSVCLAACALLWWFAPRSHAMILVMIAVSAAAMALQTVAAKRGGVEHGVTTTFATGTLTQLIQDIAEGRVRWWSNRWVPLAALPLGAASAVVTARLWPAVPPSLPLMATMTAMILIGWASFSQRRRGTRD